ncbi:hypothetical protein LXJ15735_27830 [Lacrimispora xylanolytica]
MFIIVPKRTKKTKMLCIKRRVPVKIEQDVAITLEFPDSYDYETLVDGIYHKIQSRYIPKRKYGFCIKSVVTGEDCRPLRGEVLYGNAIEQNRFDYDKCINVITQRYKEETGNSQIEYGIEKYEVGIAKTTYRMIEYNEEIEI